MLGKIPRADGYLDTRLENLDGNDEFHAMKAGEAPASVESSKDWSKDGLNW